MCSFFSLNGTKYWTHHQGVCLLLSIELQAFIWLILVSNIGWLKFLVILHSGHANTGVVAWDMLGFRLSMVNCALWGFLQRVKRHTSGVVLYVRLSICDLVLTPKPMEIFLEIRHFKLTENCLPFLMHNQVLRALVRASGAKLIGYCWRELWSEQKM